jgi:hypothetical protein
MDDPKRTKTEATLTTDEEAIFAQLQEMLKNNSVGSKTTFVTDVQTYDLTDTYTVQFTSNQSLPEVQAHMRDNYAQWWMVDTIYINKNNHFVARFNSEAAVAVLQKDDKISFVGVQKHGVDGKAIFISSLSQEQANFVTGLIKSQYPELQVASHGYITQKNTLWVHINNQEALNKLMDKNLMQLPLSFNPGAQGQAKNALFTIGRSINSWPETHKAVITGSGKGIKTLPLFDYIQKWFQGRADPQQHYPVWFVGVTVIDKQHLLFAAMPAEAVKLAE